ncbi:MAG: DUF4405 domain-containing protein [Candidatus Ornithospirochaeta sp.]
MNSKTKTKLFFDILMTLMLLLLMAYEMIGEGAHEWIGMGVILLFLGHHALNFHFYRNIVKGKYTIFRVLQTVTVLLLFLCMIGLAYSGVVLSRHVFSFLKIKGGRATARTIHMLSSYWCFILVGVHLGLHWSVMLKMVLKGRMKYKAIMWVIAVLIALYGVYAFFSRQIGSYMFLRSHFVFFDYEEPLVFFFLDYIAVLLCFVFIGHILSKLVKAIDQRRQKDRKDS